MFFIFWRFSVIIFKGFPSKQRLEYFLHTFVPRIRIQAKTADSKFWYVSNILVISILLFLLICLTLYFFVKLTPRCLCWWSWWTTSRTQPWATPTERQSSTLQIRQVSINVLESTRKINVLTYFYTNLLWIHIVSTSLRLIRYRLVYSI